MSVSMDLITYATKNGGTAKIRCPVLAKVAKCAKCSPATLYMIALGHKQASPQLAGRVEGATDGAVTRRDLRPDVFGPAPGAEAVSRAA